MWEGQETVDSPAQRWTVEVDCARRDAHSERVESHNAERSCREETWVKVKDDKRERSRKWKGGCSNAAGTVVRRQHMKKPRTEKLPFWSGGERKTRKRRSTRFHAFTQPLRYGSCAKCWMRQLTHHLRMRHGKARRERGKGRSPYSPLPGHFDTRKPKGGESCVTCEQAHLSSKREKQRTMDPSLYPPLRNRTQIEDIHSSISISPSPFILTVSELVHTTRPLAHTHIHTS
jgi:hypothetical protein